MIQLSQILGIVIVFGSLLASLVWLRSKGVAAWQSKTSPTSQNRRLQVRERVSLTATHSLHLIDADGKLLLIAVSPGSCSCISDLTAPREVRQ